MKDTTKTMVFAQPHPPAAFLYGSGEIIEQKDFFQGVKIGVAKHGGRVAMNPEISFQSSALSA